MAKYIVLFNPLSCNGKGEESAHRLDNLSLEGQLEYRDITSIPDYRDFFFNLADDEKVVVCGGDGTLNRFINESRQAVASHEVFYYPAGSGNDFARDINVDSGSKPVSLTKYIKHLPTVIVKGKESLFLNNVGFGIDGYCTQVGDEMRAQHKENINYAGIAIKGLLGGFHPVNATVVVDGVSREYKRCWLAPTMNGRFYGGGMMATPSQDRLNEDRTVSVMVFYGKGKLKTLMAFPSIFQGEHVRHTDMVEIISGHDIHVKFNRPCPLQIDGETVLDVTEYSVSSH